MNEIIERYGLEEWKVGVLANELHGHLGIYATVGVKIFVSLTVTVVGQKELHVNDSYGNITGALSVP